MYDVVVIGSGPGGYVAAIRAAQLGLKTACIEKYAALGGTCLNVGCIPSKALLHSSQLYEEISHLESHGISASPTLNFPKMMERKEGVVTSFGEGIDGLFKKNGVERILGHATFKDPNTLLVEGKEIQAKNFIIATGSKPTELPFLPFDEKQVISSTGALSLKEVPKKLLVIGAGIIGVELGSVYRRLGAEVVFVEAYTTICPTLDLDLSKELLKILKKQGLTFHLSAKVSSAENGPDGVKLTLESGETLEGSHCLVAVGRRPYTENLGLDAIQISLNKGKIPVDANFRTAHPHIYAIGDVIDGPMLAHKASEEGVAVSEIIAGHAPCLNYLSIPSVVYTNPEVASVGLTEAEAIERGFSLTKGKFPFKANSRARCMADDGGFVKLLCDHAGRLLGAHIIGPHAGELIAEVGLAIEGRVSIATIASMPHAHPTLSEALKEAALLIVNGKAIHL